jgi:hypothetical protein
LRPADLTGLDLEALRSAWRLRYGKPPSLRSVDLVRRMLAWRLEVDAAGGLDGALADGLKVRGRAAGSAPALPPVGARIAREWKGVVHEVAAIEGGYLYAGETFDSLSAIARKITGVRWNGPRFFGLREEPKP